MKKLVTMILTLGMAAACMVTTGNAEVTKAAVKAGDSVFLGRYEQDNIFENGEEPIEWIVLDADENEALLLSRYALDCQPYNNKNKDMTWQDSSIRRWLNDEFYKAAFQNDEKRLILEASVSNMPEEGNSEWTTSGGKDTVDKVFLPSLGEMREYFGDETSFKTEGTEYARSLGAKFLGVTSVGVAETDWWLRSPGKKQNEAACIGTLLQVVSNKQITSSIGVRPAIRISLTGEWGSLPYQKFMDAADLAEKGNYWEAFQIADNLGLYFHSKEAAASYLFGYGNQALENADYSVAIERFGEYQEYIDNNKLTADAALYEQLPESIYQLGLQYAGRGEHNKAIELFSTINQYKDVMEKLMNSFAKTHTQYRWLTNLTGAVVNAGAKGYAERKEITGKDPHFGWTLGRFLLSGYTEVDDSKEIPTFVKTVGDHMVLWFDLNQDIDQLNGNPDLSIADDSDGYDQQFGFAKTDMGRGALLVRHTDFRNADGMPVAYLHYLEANDVGVANTRIEIKEEGTYEVALDYEVHDGNLSHILNSTNNYRIYFKFNVKNGSSMFYLFDLQTGEELENYACAPNGFRIDLANSHSLKIDVVRYAMNQSGTGLDVRSSAPASDGDQFTRVGYYEITITNSETKEKLTKYVFVGDNEDLTAYKEADHKLDLFAGR